MRRLKFLFLSVVLCLILSVGAERGLCVRAEGGDYYVGGMTAGFLLSAGGVEIIELNEVQTEGGTCSPAKDAGLRAGDRIVRVDGREIRSIRALNEALGAAGENEITLSVLRGAEQLTISLCPVKDRRNGDYKIGILIRDTLSGIGTVTCIERESGKFAALGHSITDEARHPLEISDPKVYLCSVIGVNRGMRGKAGELKGLLLNDKPFACAEAVLSTGLYGTIDRGFDCSKLELVDIAPLSEASIGKAVIYSTVDGTEPQQYEIAIAKVDSGNRDNKNFVIKVTDERLIDQTGGIVQGMSGSPILQNGKLIGAVTHVFLNDPTRGYGIGIEKMLP